MVSTAQDYARFAQMLLNGGELDGVRILAPASVQLMSIQPPAAEPDDRRIFDRPRKNSPWHGLGLRLRRLQRSRPWPTNSLAREHIFWIGAADTWFWIDPTNDLVFVGMTQRMIGPNQPNVEAISHPTVYQALVKPKL